MKTNATMNTLAGTLLALMVMTASSEAAMSKKVVDQARRNNLTPASVSSGLTADWTRNLYPDEPGGRRDLSSGQRYSLWDWTLAMLTAPLR